VAAAATAASASTVASVLQRQWYRDCLAAVRHRHSPPSLPWGKATRLPLQTLWHKVVLEGSLRSAIDWFYTASKQFTLIAASPKGVLHIQGTSIFVYNGCYLCVFTPPKGAWLGRDRAWSGVTRPHALLGAWNTSLLSRPLWEPSAQPARLQADFYRRKLVPAKHTPDETNEKQTMIPSGIRLFVLWRSSDTRVPDASQTKASFVSSVTRRSWHVCGPNLERAGHAFVSGLACAARRHTESLQEPASRGVQSDGDAKPVKPVFVRAHYRF